MTRREPGHRSLPVAPPTSVETFLEMMAAERGAARNTLESYRRDLIDAAGWLASRGGLEAASTEQLRRYLEAMERAGLAPRTAARRLSTLRQFFRFLYADGHRPDDPSAAIDAPRRGRPLPKILSEAEVDALLDTARSRDGADGARDHPRCRSSRQLPDAEHSARLA